MSLSFPVYCTACLFFFIAVLHIISAPQLMLSLINILEANKSSSVFEYDTKNLAHLLLGSISSSLHTLSNSTRSHFQISLEMFIQIQVWPLAGLWVILLKDPSLPQPAVQKALEMVLRLSLYLAAFTISSNLNPLSVPAATTTVLHWRTGTHFLPHFQVQVATGTQNANGPMLLELSYYSSTLFNLWLASKRYILLILYMTM